MLAREEGRPMIRALERSRADLSAVVIDGGARLDR
jgi:hypothetical protein